LEAILIAFLPTVINLLINCSIKGFTIIYNKFCQKTTLMGADGAKIELYRHFTFHVGLYYKSGRYCLLLKFEPGIFSDSISFDKYWLW
jgi:hypothetical protein